MLTYKAVFPPLPFSLPSAVAYRAISSSLLFSSCMRSEVKKRSKSTARKGKLNNARRREQVEKQVSRIQSGHCRVERSKDKSNGEIPANGCNRLGPLAGVHQGWGQGRPHKAGEGGRQGQAVLGSIMQEPAMWRSTFYGSFTPLIACSAGAQTTGTYPHLANNTPKGMGFIAHIRCAAHISCKKICLLAGPTAGTQVSIMNS